MADPIDTTADAPSRLVLLMGSGPATAPVQPVAAIRLRREWMGRATARLYGVDAPLPHRLPGRRLAPERASTEIPARILRGPAPRQRRPTLMLCCALLVAAVLVTLARRSG